MGKNKIIGRFDEIAILESVLNSDNSEFVAVYGRRRIGKTYLIREFFEDKICFELTGINNASLLVQLQSFSQSLNRSLGINIMTQVPDSWPNAFEQLRSYLESPVSNKRKGKRVVFIDELPWLNTPRSNFLSALEYFWNSFGSRQSYLILVVCGSAASWMIQKIVRSKGGLHNRLTRQIRLLPFTLTETELFLKSRKVKLTRFQIVLLYMVMGGVPFYLLHVEPGLSAAQIIDSTCFKKDGFLRNEFDKLFSSLFENSHHHQIIVSALAKKQSGYTRSELLEVSGIPSGGTVSLVLDELYESGFIDIRVPLGNKVNDSIYRLSDEYTLFYFQWIKELGKTEPGTGYWLNVQNSPKMRAWSGFSFENICLKHTQKIKQALGIAMVVTREAPWRYFPEDESNISGTQIDLLIDRADNSVNICEMKFSESEFNIDMAYSSNLRQKKDTFLKVTKTRKNIFITMVSTYGVRQNEYYNELVSNSVTIEDLF